MKGIVWIFVLFTLIGAYADIDVKSMKQVKQIKKGLSHLRAQTHRHIKKRRFKRYFLGIEASKPFFRSIDDDILELYMAAFLQNAHPYWLEDDIFVFHSSSNRRYLNQLKRLYKKRYNIDTVIYKNTRYRKGSFALRAVKYDDIKSYMDEHTSRYITSKKKKHHKANTKKISPKKREDSTPKLATISKRKEANLVYSALRSIDKHQNQNSTRLGRYILYTQAEEPSFFGSMDGIYNLYLTGIVNGGHPKWLEDGRLVLHTAKSRDYLKRLRRLYRKRYGLHLSITKGSVRKVKLKAIDSDDLKAYLEERIPPKYIKKARKHHVSKIENKKRQTQANKKAALKKERLKKARKERLEEERAALKKEQKRVDEQKKKLRAKKEALAKKEKEAKRKEKEQKKAMALSQNKREKKRHSEKVKLLEEKKRALELERQQLEKEKKALAEAKKRLAEEKASRARLEKQRALKKEKEAAEKKRLEKQSALEAEKKRLEEQKRKVDKEKAMKKKLAEKKRAAEKKEAEETKRRAEAKKKKEDALTSELDKMLEETSNFKKKLERSESIKYY